MNERIFDMARQKGATDEQGNRAENVFCFTKDELKAFTELIVTECIDTVSDCSVEYCTRPQIVSEIKEHFGVEE